MAQARTRSTVALLGLVALLAAALSAGSATATRAETGKLALHAELSWRGHSVDCPAGTPSTVNCYTHDGSGVVPGLGPVAEHYLFLVQSGAAACPDSYRVLGLAAQFTVGGKGAIDIGVTGSTDCLPTDRTVALAFPLFTITGGTGIYAGATGTGTLRETLIPGAVGAHGKDVWDGTLLVAGLAFDVTPPALRGAIAKTITAPRGVTRVRITYRVSARDETDGVVPVSCRPPTGSRFKVGRTLVTCSASDKSGNTRRARFTVTVKPRR